MIRRLAMFVVAAFLASHSAHAQSKWLCNAYGTLHDDPSECSDPSKGGRWEGDGSATPTPSPKSDGEELLETAKNITGPYPKKGTLPDPKNGIYDCTTYMQTALEKGGFQVTKDTARQINIAGLTEGERRDLPKLLQQGDPRMTGVVGALVDSGQGRLVKSCDDLQKGDAIQYWKNNKGHTGFVESSDGAKVVLWGAHESKGKVTFSEPINLKRVNHCWAVRPAKSSR